MVTTHTAPSDDSSYLAPSIHSHPTIAHTLYPSWVRTTKAKTPPISNTKPAALPCTLMPPNLQSYSNQTDWCHIYPMSHLTFLFRFPPQRAVSKLEEQNGEFLSHGLSNSEPEQKPTWCSEPVPPPSRSPPCFQRCPAPNSIRMSLQSAPLFPYDSLVDQIPYVGHTMCIYIFLPFPCAALVYFATHATSGSGFCLWVEKRSVWSRWGLEALILALDGIPPKSRSTYWRSCIGKGWEPPRRIRYSR